MVLIIQYTISKINFCRTAELPYKRSVLLVIIIHIHWELVLIINRYWRILHACAWLYYSVLIENGCVSVASCSWAFSITLSTQFCLTSVSCTRLPFSFKLSEKFSNSSVFWEVALSNSSSECFSFRFSILSAYQYIQLYVCNKNNRLNYLCIIITI